MRSDQRLDIWKVSDDFASMLRMRDIMLTMDPPEDVSAIENEIARYFTHDVTLEKIDTVIGALRHAETMAAVAKAEKDRLKKLEASWTTQAEWLKETVRGVLDMSGQKRLDGKTAGYLLLKGNGGKQEVVITKADLIPEEMVQYEGRISGQAWEWLSEYMFEHMTEMFGTRTPWEAWSGRADVQMQRVPHKGRIAEALSAKCSICSGPGMIANGPVKESCPQCDGDGKNRVPGAHFASRGCHIVVK